MGRVWESSITTRDQYIKVMKEQGLEPDPDML